MASAVAIAMDALVRSNQPTNNFGGQAGMKVQTGPPTAIVHIHAALSPQIGTVQSAKLRIFQAGQASTGSRTLSARRITEAWREDKVTWANRPARVATASDTATVAGVGNEGRMVEFDVTADCQKFIDGTWKNFGWAIESGNDNWIGLYSKDGKRPPQLVITWSATPAAPVDLTPAGGAVIGDNKPNLRWSFIDRAGNTTLAAVRVQIKAINTGWSRSGGYTTPAFDTGPTATSQPSSTVVVDFSLRDTAYGGISVGGTVWWTAQHRDGAGLWSSWSDPQSMTYQPQQAVSLTSPPAGTVNDTTFPVAWTAVAQSRYELMVRDGFGTILWRQVVTSTSLRQHQVPRGIITKSGGAYEVVLRVWDALDRQALPGAPAYVEVTRTVTYADTTDVTPVTGLNVDPVDGRPSVELTWTRSPAPSMFAVWVDGVEHIVGEPSAFGSGPGYRYPLAGIATGKPHTFVVKAITETTSGGVTTSRASANNPVAEVDSITPIGVWLVDPSNPDRVVLLLEEPGQDIVEVTMPERVTVYEPLGSSTKVQVTSALLAREGAVSGGVIADYGSLSADDMHATLMQMKGSRLKPVRLIWGRDTLDVWLSNVEAAEDSIPGVVRYRVGFSFVAIRPATEYLLS